MKMNLEKAAKIEEIYHSCLDVSPELRPSFLANACGDDKELREEVESLLSFAEISSNLIDHPPTDVAAELFSERRDTEFIGKEIGHYQTISLIGVGGMGEVYLARDVLLDRNVAIKFIKTEFAQEPDKLRRFLQEAKTASSLNHPNIITVYEIGNEADLQFIATEFIEGTTLRKLMNEGSLNLNQFLDITIQVATALNAAHAAGILHRDIKPENIMLREDGLVKVLDFGLAKIVGGHSQKNDFQAPKTFHKLSLEALNNHLTAPDLMMGTVAYISPEQARFETIDARSDLWSLSIVLYEMLKGCQPFKGNTTGETISAILNKEVDPLAENIPADLIRILDKGLQKNVENRYQTAAGLLNDLKLCQIENSLESEYKYNTKISLSSGKTSFNETRISARVLSQTDDFWQAESKNLSGAENIFKKVGNNKVVSTGFLGVILFIISLFGYNYFVRNSQPVNSIAVMPFVNASDDSNMEYLSDGISESLINSLSQLSSIKVIPQSSSFKYKGKEGELEKNARELGVQFILRGRISQNANNLQVSAELVDLRDMKQVWSSQFNRNPQEISDVEREISQQIADKLRLNLTSSDQQKFAKKQTPNPQAYELYMKGRFFYSKSSFETSKKAIEYYDQALAIDPNFAQAYAALANVYLYVGQNGFLEPKEILEKAKVAAAKAIELNNNLPEANFAMAGIKIIEWDWKGADREYKRAIELNPNLGRTHFGYAFYLSAMGQYERAISEITIGRELDPLRASINADIGFVYYFGRQYDKAMNQYEIARELDPNFGPNYYGKGFTFAAEGKYSEAINNYREMIKLSGDHTGVDCYLGFALAKAGQISEAKTILKKLETGKEYVSPVELAILYVGLNETVKALASLERGYDLHDSQMQYLLVDPHFNDLRLNPHFQDLLKRVGFETIP